MRFHTWIDKPNLESPQAHSLVFGSQTGTTVNAQSSILHTVNSGRLSDESLTSQLAVWSHISLVKKQAKRFQCTSCNVHTTVNQSRRYDCITRCDGSAWQFDSLLHLSYDSTRTLTHQVRCTWNQSKCQPRTETKCRRAPWIWTTRGVV